jgi:hypothetical protein
MIISELIVKLTEIKNESGDLPVYVDENVYRISKDLRVWHCKEHNELDEHVHIKPYYSDPVM